MSAVTSRVLAMLMRQAMEALPHGFDPTDRLLLHHGSLLADAYDLWFKHWSTAQNVRAPDAVVVPVQTCLCWPPLDHGG
jgi:hypothetical protein